MQENNYVNLLININSLTERRLEGSGRRFNRFVVRSLKMTEKLCQRTRDMALSAAVLVAAENPISKIFHF